MDDKVLFVHLSDIHIAGQADAILGRANSIAAATFHRLPEVATVILLVSGDIAYGGKAREYALALPFLNSIRTAIRSQRNIPVYVFTCPGNHDCNFEKDSETREAVLAKIRREDKEPSADLIATSTAIQSEYFACRDDLLDGTPIEGSLLCWSSVISVGSKHLLVRALNVAWMSEIKEKQGTLVFPAQAVKSIKEKDVDLAVSILHHPYNWFGQTSYRALQKAVRENSQIVFTGHEHVQNVGEVTDLHSPVSVFVEGGVLYEAKDQNKSQFNLVLVNLQNLEYLTELYSWNGEFYTTSDEFDVWQSLRPLESYKGDKCELLPEWSQKLSDPGANFSHSSRRTLALDDFYVWPELKYIDDTAQIKKNVAGSYFINSENLNDGILVRGDEKAGKTTLLYQFFKKYHDRGYLPVYFRGAWFSRAHMNSPLKALNFALDKQYTKECKTKFHQAGKERKILLLDDIDSNSLSPKELSECLSALAPYFCNTIATATDASAAMDVLSIDRVEALKGFSQYEIQEFGHKKRFELVCKWAELGGDTEDNSQQWMISIDKWEKDLTAAVGRQFVPAVPIFLLTLLQSIESGRNVDLKNSAFGHYYHFLISSALQNVGIDREAWSEVFNYCSNLAWFMYSSESVRVPIQHLREFTERYKKEYTSEITYDRRLSDLDKAGILTAYDGEVSFKYPYLYYFFVGQYIAEGIHDSDMQSVIAELCSNIQQRDCANILLFASHHTKSPVIYEEIAATLDRCFEGVRPFNFTDDVGKLNSLVNTPPTLSYIESSVKESRMKVREEQDQEDTSYSDLAETNAAVLRLFRSMEILGQFLKNHYGTTKNPVKDKLISKVVDGSLRGMQGIVGSFMKHSDALLEHVEQDALENGDSKDERLALIKRYIFDIMSAVTFAFIHKASSSIGSTHLRENLKSISTDRSSLAYDLVNMSYQMDLPDAINFSELKTLNLNVNKNIFALALLRTLALKHLHLFKVNYKDKQRLCEELGIALNQQMAIQYEHRRVQSSKR